MSDFVWSIIGLAFALWGIIGFIVARERAYKRGFEAGKVAEWNRINDAKLERDRLRKLRDGRTREFKRAIKGKQ